MEQQTFIARRINNGEVTHQVEFDAIDQHAAWLMAQDGIDPLSGEWVQVIPKPTPRPATTPPPAPGPAHNPPAEFPVYLRTKLIETDNHGDD